MPGALALALAGLTLLLSACSERPTGVLVAIVIDEDNPPDGLENVGMRVTSPGIQAFDNTGNPWDKDLIPGDLAIYSRVGAVPVTIEVVANLTSGRTIERLVQLTLVEGELLFLRIELDARCIPVDCSKGSKACADNSPLCVGEGCTCIDGCCQSAQIDPGSLPRIDPDNPRRPSYEPECTSNEQCSGGRRCAGGQCVTLVPPGGGSDGGPDAVPDAPADVTGDPARDVPQDAEPTDGPRDIALDFDLSCNFMCPAGGSECKPECDAADPTSCGSGNRCNAQGCCESCGECCNDADCGGGNFFCRFDPKSGLGTCECLLQCGDPASCVPECSVGSPCGAMGCVDGCCTECNVGCCIGLPSCPTNEVCNIFSGMCDCPRTRCMDGSCSNECTSDASCRTRYPGQPVRCNLATNCCELCPGKCCNDNDCGPGRLCGGGMCICRSGPPMGCPRSGNCAPECSGPGSCGPGEACFGGCCEPCLVCSDGRCLDDCRLTGCPGGQVCSAGCCEERDGGVEPPPDMPSKPPIDAPIGVDPPPDMPRDRPIDGPSGVDGALDCFITSDGGLAPGCVPPPPPPG